MSGTGAGGSKPVDLAIIVSVITNRLLCPFEDYRQFLNFSCGTEVPLWDVTTARWATRQRLLRDFPELGDLPEPPEKTDSGAGKRYVKQCGKHLGGIECYTLAPGKTDYAVRTLSDALR